MKFILIAVANRRYKVAQCDIIKIHITNRRKSPALPVLCEEEGKIYSPTTTDGGDDSFSLDSHHQFLL
jgi:hypothetical protein